MMRSLPLLLVAALACACDAGHQPSSAVRFDTSSRHPFFPLRPGATWRYEGVEDGKPRHEVVAVGDRVETILGIACAALVQQVWVAGDLVEHTTEWFAHDQHGNVWKFGEETIELHDERLVRSPESWVAGEQGAAAWIAFPARLARGDTFTGWRPDGEDRFEVLSVGDTALVPAGTFDGCVTLIENADDPDDTDIILYAPGVGRVSERSASGQVVLVEVGGQ